MQKLCPGPQALAAVRQKQQAVTQAWKTLQLRVEQRRAQLERAHLLVRFHTAVRALSSWEGCVCTQMCAHTEALLLWRENRLICPERANARVCDPGRTGLDGDRGTKGQRLVSFPRSPVSDSLMSLYVHGFRQAAGLCHQPHLSGSLLCPGVR